MVILTGKRAFSVAIFTVALAALPAIYAGAHPEGSAPSSTTRMSSGCDGMMRSGMMGRSMMGGGMGGMTGKDQVHNSMMGSGGMTGGQPPNQQWRQ